LIKDGCTIIPSALFPNEIQIRYVSSRINNDTDIVPNNNADDTDSISNNIADDVNAEPNNYNVIRVESGNAGWAYMN
jgi:hypothetical protein